MNLVIKSKKIIATYVLMFLGVSHLFFLLPHEAKAAQVGALLHMDGTDASTTFTESCNNLTTTVSGNAQIDTAQSKFGGAAGLFDGASDMVTMADSDKWHFGTANFTVDFWFRPTNTTAGLRLLVAQYNSGVYAPWFIGQDGTSLILYATSADGSYTIANARSIATGISATTWYHVALVRNGSTWTTYLNGAQTDTFTSSLATYDSTSFLRVGSADGGTYSFNGHIEEVRIIKGVAAWTAAFTAPTVAYDTCLINAPSGQTTFTTPVYINEDAAVTGALAKGSGSFVIDHPLDPVNKLLYHSFVESPDVKNIYDGIAVLDSKGVATIKLPDYFEALNKDYRFLLTPIGAPAPELFVQSSGVVDNKFTIAGGPPLAQVSWQVTGIRQDPYILANPIIPEVMKGPEQIRDIGKFLFNGYEL